ncbi:phycobilisome rod-core linker polypeptide [Lyngbya confervoides]|uniref:Phycobilisome rod-core linker polypeptide n=1 Tax=Lyngbya confervoides BDU141951 TaxID=1574623 RepID=A0ABD4T6K2_9CYAN|nr:phycobilisome rod-core linker polypeptide [Lyngbya confervoides]MCM1984185.1 phycobilisome rod-core linker polypeptide [Lyngbya confervoides BDU141951]
MVLPLLEFPTTSRNYRVASYEISGDEAPRQFSTDYLQQSEGYDALIEAAYRQIFNAQHFTVSSRIRPLESQLRNGTITVRDFIRGLLISPHFRTFNYESNNNYRFVQMCIQRVLGRDVEDEREKLAWSIVLATRGLEGFVNELLNTEEYLNTFGENTVPYQRRRVIAQHSVGAIPFERMARYDRNHLQQLQAMGNDFSANRELGGGLPPENIRRIGAVITYTGATLLLIGVLAVVLSWFGLISI